MKISIAMATYNGAAYLQEQLDSFCTQTHLPDEVVVTDDGSTDKTISLIKQFADRAPFEVHYSINEQNLGYAGNFSQAIQKCRGDVIFLSDQDDIWLTEKIARVKEQFEKNSTTLLVMCDAQLIQADGALTEFTQRNQILALGLDPRTFTAGCCMAIRKSLVPILVPFPTKYFAHDTWINRLALELNAKHVIPEVMQYYRRHNDTTSSWLGGRAEKLSQVDLFKEYQTKDPRPFCLHRLNQIQVVEQRLNEKSTSITKILGVGDYLNRSSHALQRERRAVENRVKLLKKPRWRRVVSILTNLVGGDYRFFSGWKSAAKDLLFH